VNVPRYENVEDVVTVPVPHVEQRNGVRTVCRMVQDFEMREVCRDEGHWVDQPQKVVCGSACGGCGKEHYVSCRVWVPNIVRHQVRVPVMRPEWVEVPYQYNVTVMRPEQRRVVRQVCRLEPQEKVVMQRVCEYEPVERVRMVRVCEMQPRERMREVSYVECEERREVRMVNETRYRVVEEERVVNYTVCVPRRFEQEVEVDVCRMVPREIEVPVSCESCHDCAPAAPVFARRAWRCRGC
jgi:hypothetical protein